MIRAFILSFSLFSLACANHIAGLRSSNESDYASGGLFSLNLEPSDPQQPLDEVWSPDSGPIMIEVEEFDEPTFNALKDLLPEIERVGHKEITVKIDSYGGSVHWGMQMMQLFEDSNMRTKCVVDTKAMSMGFFMLESCDERLMTKRSTLMAHEPWTRTQGNANELQETAIRLRILCESMVEIAVEKMKITKAEMMKKIDGKEWHMGWEEAMKVGAVDGTVKVDELPKKYNMKIKELSLLDLLGGSSK